MRVASIGRKIPEVVLHVSRDDVVLLDTDAEPQLLGLAG
jgi:hypothetical protein